MGKSSQRHSTPDLSRPMSGEVQVAPKRNIMKYSVWLVVAIAFCASSSLQAASYYSLRPEDSKAVYLSRDNFSVHGDGVADDSDAIQNAIDRVQETTVQGIVFIPEGRYRMSKTIIVWPGIRLIGYGQTRPVFVL